MAHSTAQEQILENLNPQQREAVTHGEEPLLVIAGAGTGKTATLVHRVAWLVSSGVAPGNILLLTFTRRSAGEMVRRAEEVLRRTGPGPRSPAGGLAKNVWGGTFHAVATRLLRQYGKALRIRPDFTILDRGDAEDLMNVLRTELKLAATDRRFPKKGTCVNIYSRCVNAQEELKDVLARRFPWCSEWSQQLAQLFDAYVERKTKSSLLDYDDLLLYWKMLLGHEEIAPRIRRRFRYVLVDEYQDTNALQSQILYRLCPDGRGLAVVGDDAQAIYSFRAATVRNILEFPKHYPGTRIVTLEQNYRSTMPVLDASNAVMKHAQERYTKTLFSDRTEGPLPELVTCEDEDEQSRAVIERILELRERGIELRRQAVLFRASHHSILLEGELSRRNIPYHKYGGLKFLEMAHVKDLLSFLRMAENPRDMVAGMRVLAMLPGVGPATARRLMEKAIAADGDFRVWSDAKPPKAATERWPRLLAVLEQLCAPKAPLADQIHIARKYYEPLLEELYDNPQPRARDLEQIEQLALKYRDRRTLLADITLDPPSSTQDFAAPPLLDDDYLVLSTIHSAKGLEWDAVYIIHATDGHIPSDMATGSDEEIEEERRLFYVAMTRAKRHLFVCHPIQYHYHPYSGRDDRGLSKLTRFIAADVKPHFQSKSSWAISPSDEEDEEFISEYPAKPPRATDGLW